MATTKSLHTLNARDHVMLEVVRDYFKLSPQQMFHEIQAMRNRVENALALKGIEYEKLKSALVPDRKRKEAAFVFDTTAIQSNLYGYNVFEKLIPLLDKDANQSILVGDYIDNGKGQDLLYDALSQAMCLARNVNFQHSSQFFIVYINNLTDRMLRRLDEGMVCYEAYIGFADTSCASVFKILLSTMLVNLCIKHHNVIIQGHEPDRPDDEDINMCGYPFDPGAPICRYRRQ